MDFKPIEESRIALKVAAMEHFALQRRATIVLCWSASALCYSLVILVLMEIIERFQQ